MRPLVCSTYTQCLFFKDKLKEESSDRELCDVDGKDYKTIKRTEVVESIKKRKIRTIPSKHGRVKKGMNW